MLNSIIDQHHEHNQEPPRPHLGASLLGHCCDRYLWLSFRWAYIDKFPGRILRLFRRGQLEEETIIADMRAAGLVINERQTSCDFGSHISGSADGIITSGVPGAEQDTFVLECKTHSKKSFDDLTKKGVLLAKPMHYVQMQIYMLGLKVHKALYYSICKDDDRIYTEIVEFNRSVAEKNLARGKKIALSDYMPEPISADPSWYQCKLCSAKDFCHVTKTTKEVNCRTCAFSTATEDSHWRCARNEDDVIPVQFQRSGCNQHVMHPDLVPWKRQESDNPHEAIYLINGIPVRNGEPEAYVYSSRELLADPTGCANADDTTEQLRDVFEGKLVEINLDELLTPN